MKTIQLFLIIIIMFAVNLFAQQDTIRVATYNILNFSGSNGGTRIADFRTVTQSMNPDILVVQEMIDESGVQLFQSQGLSSEYSAVPFHDGRDTDNALYYRSSVFEFVGADYLTTALRDIAEYEMKHRDSGESLFIYSAHLKASSGTDNEQKRLAEVDILMNHIAAHLEQSNRIVVGDFNVYTAAEPAFVKLLQDSLLLDPINAEGDWHSNQAYASLHTQSSRGGSYGGLDDRFDMILISKELKDNILPATYCAFGNDGQHLNESINEGMNIAVPTTVANALYDASDHIPVMTDFVFQAPTAIHAESSQNIPHTFELGQNYPNPFNSATILNYRLPVNSHIKLEVLNILGKSVMVLDSGYRTAGEHQVRIESKPDWPSGIYYVRLTAGDNVKVRKIILLK